MRDRDDVEARKGKLCWEIQSISLFHRSSLCWNERLSFAGAAKYIIDVSQRRRQVRSLVGFGLHVTGNVNKALAMLKSAQRKANAKGTQHASLFYDELPVGKLQDERKLLNKQRFFAFFCLKFAQLAMSLYFPLPKIHSFHFSLHTSRLSLHGEVTMVALKFPMSSHVHFPLQTIFFALFVPPLSNGTSRGTSDRKPKTNDQILPSPILFFPSKKWIKLIPKTIGNRKRDCAWGGSGW